MNRSIAFFLCLLLNASPAINGQTTLLPDSVVAALSQELSGETAKNNLEYITRFHRMRGSRGFHSAAEHIVKQLLEYGLTDARIEQFPADGKTFYGTQKSRPPWDAEFAELWELRETNTGWTRHARLASWNTMPITLAQDSESGEALADLIDVNNGTAASDYEGKDLEVARTFNKLISEGKLPRPARTIRFIWPPEIEGTVTLLNARPEIASRIKSVIHMDMVGGGPVRRNLKLKGPMSVFGYDYFTDHYGAERERALRLPQFQGLRGAGGEYAYEVLNLVNGRRTAQEIRDAVAATYGPIPLELVFEYLRALETARVIEAVKD